MKFQTRFLLLLANGFVGYYYWNAYKHGMPAGHTLLFLAVSLIVINLALFFGKKLGESRTPRK